jgi:hypothetical protein
MCWRVSTREELLRGENLDGESEQVFELDLKLVNDKGKMMATM